MDTIVPSPGTNVQDVTYQPEPAATAQVPKINPVEDNTSTTISHAANTASTPVMAQGDNQNITLGQGHQRMLAALKAGELGELSSSIVSGIEEHIIPYFGQNVLLKDISVATVENFIDQVVYEKDDACAKIAYDAGQYLFDYFVSTDVIKDNPFSNIDPAIIPGNSPGEYDDEYYEPILDYAVMQKFLFACLNCIPKFSAVKAAIVIYLVYGYALTCSEVLQITWSNIDELRAAGKLDNFISRLLDNYQNAQKRWLKQKRISNPEGYLFVKKGEASGEGIPCDSGFVSTWIKTHITNRRGMPYLTINTLRTDDVDLGPLKDLDKDAFYPILGKVIIDGDYYRRGNSFNASSFSARWTGPETTFRTKHRPKAGSGNRV